MAKWGSGPTCYQVAYEIDGHSHNVMVNHDQVDRRLRGNDELPTMNALFNQIYDDCLEGCPNNYQSADACKADYDAEQGFVKTSSITRGESTTRVTVHRLKAVPCSSASK